MPTIDQLAPATAASDTDELLVSQNGIARKATRAQLLAGVQTQLAIGSGTLLGRSSGGMGAPEQISIGANLTLINGDLSAAIAPFDIAALVAGTVPASGDLVPLGQAGNTTAVSYSQFMSGLSAVTNVDISHLLVTPTGGHASARLGDFAASALPLAGGSLTGVLTLAADPTTSQQAATKRYVDSQVATSVPRAGGTLTGALTLAMDPTAPLQAATKQYTDARVSRSGDTLTGTLTLAADPAKPLQAATKGYVDAQIVSMLPKAGGTLTGPLILPSNPSQPLQAAPKQYVDGQVASALPLGGGTLTGALTLADDPASALQAATKRYVDCTSGQSGVINVRAAPYNAALNGLTDDTAAFAAAYQAAAAGSVIHVPFGVTVLQPPSRWGVPLTKRVKWIVDGTSLPDGTPLADAIPGGGSPAANYLPGIVVGNSAASIEVSQTGSQPTDFAVAHSSYIVNHSGGPTGGAVITNSRNDTIIYSCPSNFVWGGLDRLLWCGSQTPGGAPAAEHVGRYVQTIRQNVGLDGSGRALPQPNLWAACLEYRDTTGQPSSMAASSITVEMDWFGNGPDDAALRQIQSLVIGQHDKSGAPIEVGTIIGVYLDAGCTGHAYQVFNVNVPFSVSVLDTTAAQQMAGAAAIRLAAGHAIAFEPTNTCRLAYDSVTNTLRWYQGTLVYPVGKGIAVGWQTVYASSATLSNSISGNIVFLIGGSPYTMTLPAASTVAAGTGFTFSVIGSANVSMATTGKDTIDNGPVTLRPNDRYHVVSDGTSAWHEVFRTNAVNPHFSGPPVLPVYIISTLPGSPGTGAKAFASNGRKPGEGPGAGTGVEVFYDGRSWISVCSGSAVAA